jgi:hypothetical protein
LKDSEKVLPTVRRARRHLKREEAVPASNGMEEALAAQDDMRRLAGEVLQRPAGFPADWAATMAREASRFND